MTPFKSMLLTLRSGPESLALTARQVPVYLMVVILHIPLPCWHGAANCRHRLSRIASTTTTYNSWRRDGCPPHTADTDIRYTQPSQDHRIQASYVRVHHSRASHNDDAVV